jgi:peptide-methionine (R)-S-oxide reductase
MPEKIIKTEEEWKKELGPKRYRILREKGTELPGTGEYYHSKEKGTYLCGACGQELFSSDTKFESGTGWPSFWEPIAAEAVETKEDASLGMRRVEVTCSRCGSHLGHVFDDGPADKTGKRFCINSASLTLKKKE